MDFQNITLEISLKPFRDTTADRAREVCRRLFGQWAALLKHTERVSVMLWIADGSEILEYQGDLDGPFEWARYIGIANKRRNVPGDPEGIALHSRAYLYMDDPPVFTYGWLKGLTQIIKDVGRETTGKTIRVGATFDPGGEFARSEFKYDKHNEICLGSTMGAKSFVCCYATLHADAASYAGFPDGIPEGTPFGAFFGRQCKHFLADLGFDYIWLSNGFGFGMETWGLRGAVFDGERFSSERCEEVRGKIIQFWELFRQECPDAPIETRGTNLSTGMDLSSDAVPLREIYRSGYGMEPPPNSPWAALNGDFGLELIGWMSHIAEIPATTFPFRFYTHDPWWLNSPWLDRYGREPHDIYLPLSVSRLDAEGRVCTPTALEFLTCDDSYGHMPDRVPNEVIPHLLEAREHGPDAPGPLVWVYPFDEYHEWTYGQPSRIHEVFFGDWFMRGAVNHGLPLNTVISTGSLAAALRDDPGRFREHVLVSPVPACDTEWSRGIMGHVERGGAALLYGPLGRAGAGLLDALGLEREEPLEGEFELGLDMEGDMLSERPYADRLVHHGLLSAGGIAAAPRSPAAAHALTLATAAQGQAQRVVAQVRSLPEWKGGMLLWVRGTVSCDPSKMTGHLLVPLDPGDAFHGETLMRLVLGVLGFECLVEKRDPSQPDPMLVVSRHRGAFFFSGYVPNTTVRQHLRFPQGAPILLGLETMIENGCSTYSMPRAWRRECRVFVEQEQDGEISCRERHSGMVGVKRRMWLGGLNNATVRFYHEPGSGANVKMLRNPVQPYLVGDFVDFTESNEGLGAHLAAHNVTGELLISW